MKHPGKIQFQADPNNWPKEPEEVTGFALIVIDMQNDYCTPGFYMDEAGYDTDTLRKPVKPLQQVLPEVRKSGIELIYTRHSNSLDPDFIKEGGTSAYLSFGWQIIPELQPQKHEKVFDKITISALMSGKLHKYLQKKKINNLIFCGNTIDVCVHSSLRTANDLGYACLLLDDCCGAVNQELHTWSVESIKVEDGIFGAVSNSSSFISDLRAYFD